MFVVALLPCMSLVVSPVPPSDVVSPVVWVSQYMALLEPLLCPMAPPVSVPDPVMVMVLAAKLFLMLPLASLTVVGVI